MIDRFDIVIHGKPHPKQRPRFGGGRAYSPKSNTENAKDIQAQFMVQRTGNEPLTGALYARISYYMPKPKSKCRVNSNPFPYADTKPDLDNMLKQTLDSLNGLMFIDDSQIVSVVTNKMWASPDDERTVITIGRICEDNYDDMKQGAIYMIDDICAEAQYASV